MLVSTVASREQLCLQARLETAKLDYDVTLDGRVLHTCAAASGKARPPMVAQRTRGMMSTSSAADVDSPHQSHDKIRRQDTTVPDH